MTSLMIHSLTDAVVGSYGKCSRLLCVTIQVLLSAIMLMFNFAADLAAAQAVKQQAYTLDTADTLRVNVFGEPNYPLEVTVDDSGFISIPLLGEVQARGQTTSGLANSIQTAFRESQLLKDAFVQVSILQYRPFFISGAVSSPGAYPYKPGMTVRHAIAIAGGFKAIQLGSAPELTIADLRSERDALLIEVFRRHTQLARLQAELHGDKDFDATAKVPLQVDPDLISEILAVEREQLRARQANLATHIEHLERSLDRTRQDEAVMQQARMERENATRLQREELEAYRALREKGLTAQSRVLAAERAQSFDKIGEAEMDVQQTQIQQRISDVERQIAQAREEYQAAVLSQIEEAQLALGGSQSRLRYVTDKLQFVSEYGEHRSLDELRHAVEMVIHRNINDLPEIITADENTLVRAGDLIEVSVLPRKEFYEGGVTQGDLSRPAPETERSQGSAIRPPEPNRSTSQETLAVAPIPAFEAADSTQEAAPLHGPEMNTSGDAAILPGSSPAVNPAEAGSRRLPAPRPVRL